MLVSLERTVGKGPSVRIVRNDKKEITTLDELGVLAKWSGVQAVVDASSITLLSFLSGRDPVELLLDPQLKFLLIGPAVLSFGAIGTRFHVSRARTETHSQSNSRRCKATPRSLRFLLRRLRASAECVQSRS